MADFQYYLGGGSERWTNAAALHGETFKTDPVLNFLLHTMPAAEREAYLPQLLGVFMKAAALCRGSIWDEVWAHDRPADDSHAAPATSAVWLAPGTKIDDWRLYLPAGFVGMVFRVGLGGAKRMLFDFQTASDRAKREGLRNPDGSPIKKYYYLFFISTDARERGKGLSSRVIRAFQAKAAAERLPIWLESTTARSHALYLKLGFKDVRAWTLGKGCVDKDGKTEKDGDGVPIWAMLWRPEDEKGADRSTLGVEESRGDAAAGLEVAAADAKAADDSERTSNT